MAGDWRRLALAALAAAVLAWPAAALAQDAAQPKAAAKAKKAAKKKDEKKQDPADAQQAIEAAHKLLQDGKSVEAEEALTTLLKGGKLPPAIMARALLYRGIAHRQQKKPAQAIADLTSALWVKGGLGEADRKDALRQRTSAYQEAGVGDGGEPVAALPSGARTASSEGGASPGAGEPAPKQGGWLGNPFSGWFGGGASAQGSGSAPPPQEGSPSSTASIDVRERPPRREASSAWSSGTDVRTSAPATASVPGPAPAASERPAPQPAPTVAAARPDGRFRVQVGMTRTQAEAETLAARLKRDHAGILATREPEIDTTVVGNMGSFYRVRIGPYASAGEGQAACAKLRGPGIDCLVVTQ